MNKNSTIYLAGHTGLVGSALHRKLLKSSYTNIITRELEQLDLTNQQTTADLFEKEKPEYVILAAAKVGGIMANNTYRAQFIYENLQIQNNVIHQAYLNGVNKLLFLGSSCIYPKNAPQPLKEEYLLTGELEYTNEPYAIAKIAGIKMCESYNIQYGTNFISVMPTNLYGPGDNYDLEKSHVLPALIRKMHLGKCLENNDWKSIRKDLNSRPIEGINGKSSEEEIQRILSKYGISFAPSLRRSISSSSHPITSSPHHSSASSRSVAPSLHRSSSSRSVALTLWGSGTPKREFLHVDDMASACLFLMENIDFTDIVSSIEGDSSSRSIAQSPSRSIAPSPLRSSSSRSVALSLPRSLVSGIMPIKNTHVNIGCGEDLSIRSLAELIKVITGFQGELNWDSSKPDGTLKKQLSMDKLHKLGWKEKIQLEDGISKVYNDYKEVQT